MNNNPVVTTPPRAVAISDPNILWFECSRIRFGFKFVINIADSYNEYTREIKDIKNKKYRKRT